MATQTKSDLSITTTDHPNAKRTREAFEAFTRGDLETVRASLTSDCAWTNAGTSPIAGTYKGWDSISAMFGKLIDLTDGTFSMKVVSCMADDQHAVTIYDATSTIHGKKATERFCLIDEMTRDGKAKATHVLAYDQPKADKHWNA
ncbi:MAG: nuclear transport factor 2 family protein [Mycobacteriales bacterium]